MDNKYKISFKRLFKKENKAVILFAEGAEEALSKAQSYLEEHFSYPSDWSISKIELIKENNTASKVKDEKWFF
jgi:hypothetical protein